MRRAVIGAGVVACAALCSGASAQSAWSGLRPVDPGRADMGHLAVQTRLVPVDLRQPLDFEQLFETRGTGPAGAGQPWFVRRDAGVTAVFNRSVYVPVGSMNVPLVPPDTTFVIGEPNSILAQRLGLVGSGAAGVSGAGVAWRGAGRDASGGLRMDTLLPSRLDDRAGAVFGPARRRGDRPGDGGDGAADAGGRRGVGALLRRAGERERRRGSDGAGGG